MPTHDLFPVKDIFDFLDEAFAVDFTHRNMMKFCGSLWVLICNFVLSWFGHFIKHLARSELDDGRGREDQIVRSSSGLNGLKFGGFCEEEKSELTFGFQFQMKEEDLVNNKGVDEAKAGGITDSVFMENGLISKYQFMSVKDFGGFVAEPESVNFTVNDMFVEEGSKEDDFILKKVGESQHFGEEEVNQVQEPSETSNLAPTEKVDEFKETEVSSGETLQRVDISDKETVNHEEKTEDSVDDASFCDESYELKETIPASSGASQVLEPQQVNWLGEFFLKEESFSYGVQFSQENELHGFDSQLESDDSGDGFFSISPQNIGSLSSVKKEELECHMPSVNVTCHETFIQEDPSSEEIDEDFIDLEPHLEDFEKELKNSDSISEPHLEKFDKEQWNSDSNGELELDNSIESEDELMKTSQFAEKIRSWEFDSDEEDDADVLLEHQELIGQMKMELKNARTGGLPTILEECETPRIKEDMKPLKIDEKLEHRDQMAEIQKFYKSYAEKMRKLDVLNYQTLQAINFLRMKHPDQLNMGGNSSLSAFKSVFLPSFWPCKLRRIYADPTLKSITELQRDLEIVYVGQTCLSWEILHWQYKKVKELQNQDPQGYRSYNQIAVEFQQFHVLLQRFTEEETFQGPRVQNYAKQRCVLRGLLQVPAIKDDNLKEKKARRGEDGDAVSISTLADMIKESMRVFWEFVHSDKDTTNLFLSIVLQGAKAYLQDPADSDLLMDIKTSHQKKDKRLKDLLRTGNCIARKFQKAQGETILDQNMFVSQVELRLVSRVLSLPRLSRDQLLWCQTKLNNVKFMGRTIRMEEDMFLLFPC